MALQIAIVLHSLNFSHYSTILLDAHEYHVSITNNAFTSGHTLTWNTLPGEAVNSQSLQLFKQKLAVLNY